MPTVPVRRARDLSAVLAAARRRRGWTQAQLAERVGVSRDYVGDMESGELGLQVTRLLRMLGELGVEVRLTLADSEVDDVRG